MNVVRDRIAKTFLSPVNPFATFLMGFTMFFWGLWVASPYWDIFDKAQVYQLMQSVAPESFWGGFSIVVGAAMILSVFNKRTSMAMATHLFAFFFWGSLAVSYLISDWESTGFITVSFFWILNAWAYLNLKDNQKSL